MGLFDRMGRVITSNVNALLDKAEDPTKSVELTLSQMKSQIHAARKEVIASVAAEKQLSGRAEQLRQEIEKWQERAELAIRHDDDQLAREALLHKRRLTAERERASTLGEEQRGRAVRMKAELERMEIKLSELAAKKGSLVAKARQLRGGGGASALGSQHTAGHTAFDEFRRMEDQIEAVEAALVAQREVNEALGSSGPSGMTQDEVEARFLRLEGKLGEAGQTGSSADSGGAVDEELANLKQRVRIKS